MLSRIASCCVVLYSCCLLLYSDCIVLGRAVLIHVVSCFVVLSCVMSCCYLCSFLGKIIPKSSWHCFQCCRTKVSIIVYHWEIKITENKKQQLEQPKMLASIKTKRSGQQEIFADQDKGNLAIYFMSRWVCMPEKW